jgi:DMSO/TMAO reductase YedYZ molybdopterin-dependent catalytic subunit
MTPRGTDWSLAALVTALVVSGLLSWDGLAGTTWIIPAHDILGLALVGIVVVKGRRVLHRPRDGRSTAGLVAMAFVIATLGSGVIWAAVGSPSIAGFTLLAWHVALGFVLFLAVAIHLGIRAKPLRRRDVTDRRQALVAGATLAAGAGLWMLQRPAARVLGLEAADRRGRTGSYPVGDDFPVTSWVADDPDPIDAKKRLTISGLVARPASLAYSDLDGHDELTATLDCTGGFVTTQRWGGVRLDRLLARSGPLDTASHVRVTSVTGYRWAFPLDHADRLLLATTLAGEPLSHGHGAPARLVAPGHRGWHWVKWVDRIEVLDGPDPGAYVATLTSSI